MKKMILGSLLFAAMNVSAAAEFGIQIHGLSHHFSPRKADSGAAWNEVNTGAGLVLRDGKVSYQIGVYKNSLSTDKFAFYSRYTILDYQGLSLYDDSDTKISFGGFFGVVHGYPFVKWNKDGSIKSLEKTGFAQALGISARAAYKKFNVTVRLTPKPQTEKTQSSAVMSIESGYTF